MFGHLLRKEILNHLHSIRFLVLGCIGAAIVWLSLFSGYGYYRESKLDFDQGRILTENHVRYLQDLGNLVQTDNPGHPVQKPPSVLSIFVRGLDPTLGTVGYVSGGDIQRLKFIRVAEEPLLGIAPPLDLALVVQLVLSLFVLLLTYDSISREKEDGTLRLSSSFSVAKHQLLLAKTCGGLILSAVGFGVPLLIGICVILLFTDVQFSKPELQRLLFILVAFGAYLLSYSAAGVLGSCLGRRAATSFVILLFFWVGSVSVVPRLSPIISAFLQPPPSTRQYEADRGMLNQSSIFKRFERQREWYRDYKDRTGQNWW